MLKRKLYDYLLEWKHTKQGECLVVKGARQVGKTFIVDQFGKTEYKSYIYLNFLLNPEHRSIFEGSLEPEEIYKRISLFVTNAQLIPGKTLIFIDEIQACVKARTALKFLAIDGRFDVIASGSLLGIHYKSPDDDSPAEDTSIPVGYEREVTMHALDFEEFLWACGVSEQAIGLLRAAFGAEQPLDAAILDRYQRYLREYLVVGGMPAVVRAFLKTNSFQAAHAEQGKILAAYEDDIDKYASNTERPKIRRLYYSIPRQLAKENTKFQYSKVERGGSARKYGDAINWLIDAGLVCGVSNVSLPELPLAAYEKQDEFKIYVSDTGLLTHMLGFETQAALASNTLKGTAKGGIYENLVFDLLHKRGHALWYFKRPDNTQEIEFLFEQDGGVVPVEAKAKRGSTPSLNGFIEQFEPEVAYKLIDGNVGRDGCKVTMPQFMGMFL